MNTHTLRPRVIAPHRPTGRDPATGAVMPIFDLRPARRFGDLHFLLRDSENPFADFRETAAEAAAALDALRPTGEDWLLLVGSPSLIGVVSALWARRQPAFRILQWDRAAREYRGLTAQLAVLDTRSSAA